MSGSLAGPAGTIIGGIVLGGITSCAALSISDAIDHAVEEYWF
ncbi:MAG: hypothetical protein ACEPOW_05640 [Bacteroidales bacterium]